MAQNTQFAFIVGSQRSGTTILGRILQAHPEVGHIYEPYYIWYYHAKDLSTDYIPAGDIGPRESDWIRRKFEVFARLTGKRVIVDKSPEHAFNLPIVQHVFPEAKIIHIKRDGRDVTLSIKKEWEKRREIVENRNLRALFKTAAMMLQRQPLWRFRFLALWYELKTNCSWNPKRFFNKAKWMGQTGWGPRFHGWQEALQSEPLIRFQALQWLHCVNQIQQDLPRIPQENVLEIRYEDLVSTESRNAIQKILSFLNLEQSQEFERTMPKIKIGNTRKWAKELTEEEIQCIDRTLSAKLQELGYDSD